MHYNIALLPKKKLITLLKESNGLRYFLNMSRAWLFLI